MAAKAVRAMKAELRSRLQKVRDGLDPVARRRESEAAAMRLFSSPLIDGKGAVMLYASIRSEVDTGPFIRLARERGMRLALPRVVRGERRMEAVWVQGRDDLAPGAMGILEPRPHLPAADPEELELVIVPGLGFDRQGYRLGYGAGYYDKFLAGVPGAVWVGLAYEACLVDSLPHEDHDLPVHYILTGARLAAVRPGPSAFPVGESFG